MMDASWQMVVEALLQLTMFLMIGLYFIFSNTIVRALAQLDNGASVMIEINKQILNPVFLTCFVGSAFAAVYFAIWGTTLELIAGSIFFIGTFLVTAVFNVPLNNKLRDASNQLGSNVWQLYLSQWVIWNHVRTVSALSSGFLLLLSL